MFILSASNRFNRYTDVMNRKLRPYEGWVQEAIHFWCAHQKAVHAARDEAINNKQRRSVC